MKKLIILTFFIISLLGVSKCWDIYHSTEITDQNFDDFYKIAKSSQETSYFLFIGLPTDLLTKNVEPSWLSLGRELDSWTHPQLQKLQTLSIKLAHLDGDKYKVQRRYLDVSQMPTFLYFHKGKCYLYSQFLKKDKENLFDFLTEKIEFYPSIGMPAGPSHGTTLKLIAYDSYIQLYYLYKNNYYFDILTKFSLALLVFPSVDVFLSLFYKKK